MSTSPDFSKYNLEQLQCARRSIDEVRFPERVAELDRCIGATIANGAALATGKRSDDDDELFFYSRSRRNWQPKTKLEAIGMICTSLISAPIAPLMIFHQNILPSTPGICTGQLKPDTFFREFSYLIGVKSPIAECSRSPL